MVKALLEAAFEKAGSLTGNSSVNGRATYLAEVISEDYRFSITPKSLTRYYKEESGPKPEVRNALAEFLGYEDYEDFVIRNSEGKASVWLPPEKKKKQSAPGPVPGKRDRRRALLFILAFLGIGLSSYYGFMAGSNECIIWDGDRYVETICSGNALEKPMNLSLLNNFRRTAVSDTTRFFRNGRPAIWYHKSNKELEYFTAPGLHPETGKTLKPITQYMIDKYIMDQ